MSSIAREELERTTKVSVGGKFRRMPNGWVIVRKLMEQAMKGDQKAALTLMRLEAAAGPPPSQASVPTGEVSMAQCEDILTDYLDVIRGGK